MTTYDLTDGQLDATRDKIAKLNARAVKRGWNGRLTLEAGDRKRVTEKTPMGFEVRYWVTPVEITGEPPKYNGWTFLARVDLDAEVGITVSAAPGVEVGPELRAYARGQCDHCHIDRKRNSTYLVRNDAGETLEVGSTCLKDFLGWDTSPVFLSTDDVTESFGPRVIDRFDTETVLAAAWAVIKAYGFHRSDSYELSTKSQVLDLLSDNKRRNELVKDALPYLADSYQQGREVRSFVLSDAFRGDSDYVWNLKRIAAVDDVTYKHIGYLVSAPQAWAREQERTLVRERESANVNNTPAGNLGDRITVNVEVKTIKYIDGPYGMSTLYTMTGDDNRLYKWFASKSALGEEAGRKATITGTIKKYDDYRGVFSTSLTRCKVVS